MLPNPIQPPQLPGAYKLVRLGHVVYVGSTDNLHRRFGEHCDTPHNHLLEQVDFDLFEWRVTANVDNAKRLEVTWYDQYLPPCNLVRPSLPKPKVKGPLLPPLPTRR